MACGKKLEIDFFFLIILKSCRGIISTHFSQSWKIGLLSWWVQRFEDWWCFKLMWGGGRENWRTSWKPLPPGFLKFRIDGEKKFSACGHGGCRMIQGGPHVFFLSNWAKDSNEAEVWALGEALWILQSSSLGHLSMYSDSFLAISWISFNTGLLGNFSICNEIKCLCSSPLVRFQ